MKIYISGKISGLDFDETYSKFLRAQRRLWLLDGVEPVNPMGKASEDAGGKPWKKYMVEDLALLLDCDAIYMLRDWKDSKGARVEHAVANALDMLVIYESIPAWEAL